AWSEGPGGRMGAGHAGRQRRSWVPSRARLLLGAGVDEQLAVNRVADVPLEGADRILLGLALAELAFELDAPLRARLADLTDRREVQGVIEPAVPALGDTVHDPATGGAFDRCGAVVGGVAVPVREPADVAGEPDQVAGDDRPDAEQLGERCLGGCHGGSDPPVRRLELFVKGVHIGEQLPGRVTTSSLCWGCRREKVQERNSVRSVEFLSDPARS